ncbi:hypothetical protein IU459_27135 [Nocardia amamiensis]|uniref:Uncharacterized protein n=1 Tax=Nocardia amamiensis TaxID=404578 RepID=A0ABS0CX77_9NOCA|nr:hypothetical protein [Nocardia amamiensis]MBF6301191.1 hypothetical protein [Nocardia amamiensis]
MTGEVITVDSNGDIASVVEYDGERCWSRVSIFRGRQLIDEYTVTDEERARGRSLYDYDPQRSLANPGGGMPA